VVVDLERLRVLNSEGEGSARTPETAGVAWKVPTSLTRSKGLPTLLAMLDFGLTLAADPKLAFLGVEVFLSQGFVEGSALRISLPAESLAEMLFTSVPIFRCCEASSLYDGISLREGRLFASKSAMAGFEGFLGPVV